VAEGEGPEIKPQKQSQGLAGCWWLSRVILATQEADIRRIAVGSQPGQIVRETQLQKTIVHTKK
jgi:hypothetical protein